VAGDEDRLFEEAMTNLEVPDGLSGETELGGSGNELLSGRETLSGVVAGSSDAAGRGDVAEEEEFLDAISSLGSVPSVPVESPVRARRALPGRARQIRRGEMVADVRLDLHGQTEAQAWTSLEACIRKARRDHALVLQVICGQGLHSRKEAVLKAALQAWLRGPLREHVLDYSPAAPKQGGRGAWWLFLRP
jgi:DNA-nicking Smr family endonuclease